MAASPIHDNLRFLIAEVGSQLANLQTYVETASPTVAQRVLDRGGYAYNLKMRIHEGCINRLALRNKGGNNGRGKGRDGDVETLALRALESIATDLERIAELARECVRRLMSLERRRDIEPARLLPLLERVARGIELVEPAVSDNDTRLALKLGTIEHKLDRDYSRLLRRYTRSLKRRKHTEELITGLFVGHAIEEMGDALLSISESIISANLGQPVNIERYHAIQESVAELESAASTNLRIEPIAETRSGSGISGITHPKRKKKEGYVAIYKDGERRKLKEERQGVESWHEIYPGLAPRILSYKKRGESASLLIEHLAGLTFEQILLHEPPELLAEALDRLGKTLRSVWRETRTKEKVEARFMAQTRKRMGSVYAVHREFRRGDGAICGQPVAGFDTLLARAAEYEKRIAPPFSVYIHGDFNLDNIIYDPLEKRINFIDLHRSSYMDYVQDVSVFMVSNYRLQILDAPQRRRILDLAQAFYAMAARFARKEGDETFELRLALGLARSFATSTRFILDKTLARRMFLRSRYLIEQVLAVDPKRAADYRVPIKEIFVE